MDEYTSDELVKEDMQGQNSLIIAQHYTAVCFAQHLLHRSTIPFRGMVLRCLTPDQYKMQHLKRPNSPYFLITR